MAGEPRHRAVGTAFRGSLSEIRLEPKILNATHLCWLASFQLLVQGWLLLRDSSTSVLIPGQQSGEERNVPLLTHGLLL